MALIGALGTALVALLARAPEMRVIHGALVRLAQAG